MNCTKCGEAPRGEDPGLSNGICVFCGYWNVAPGAEREVIRLNRLASKYRTALLAAKEAATLVEGDHGPDCEAVVRICVEALR